MQAARQAQGGEICPTPGGYLTNLFDVADPDTELSHCSDHCDGGKHTPPPPLEPPTPPPSHRAGFSQRQAAMR